MNEAPDGAPSPMRSKRRHLLTLTWLTGLSGLAVASWPFIRSLMPSAKAKLHGAPVQVDLGALAPGEQLTVAWRGQPIWVLNRDDAMLRRLASPGLVERLRDPGSEVSTQQPAYVEKETRSIKPGYFVCVAICTHLGCVPIFRPELAAPDIDEDWPGGYFCPCHKSKFDLAGRVFKGVPAPVNLVIPPHSYLDQETIVVGVNQEQV